MKSNFFFILLVLVALSSCRKDVDELLLGSAEFEVSALAEVFSTMQTAPESFMVDASSAIELTTADNIWFRCPGGAMLDPSGNAVEGEVELRILYILNKADMIRYRATTTTDDGRFLESGGEVLVQAFKNNVPLTFDSTKTYSLNQIQIYSFV